MSVEIHIEWLGETHFVGRLHGAELRVQDPDAKRERVRHLIKLRRSEERAAALREGLKIEPGHVFAVTTLAMYETDRGDEVAARAWLGQVDGQPRVSANDRETLERAFRARFGWAGR